MRLSNLFHITELGITSAGMKIQVALHLIWQLSQDFSKIFSFLRGTIKPMMHIYTPTFQSIIFSPVPAL